MSQQTTTSTQAPEQLEPLYYMGFARQAAPKENTSQHDTKRTVDNFKKTTRVYPRPLFTTAYVFLFWRSPKTHRGRRTIRLFAYPAANEEPINRLRESSPLCHYAAGSHAPKTGWFQHAVIIIRSRTRAKGTIYFKWRERILPHRSKKHQCSQRKKSFL